jgi:hypothetical protein
MVRSELAFVVLADMAVLKELFVSDDCSISCTLFLINIKGTTLMLLSCVAAGTEIQRCSIQL